MIRISPDVFARSKHSPACVRQDQTDTTRTRFRECRDAFDSMGSMRMRLARYHEFDRQVEVRANARRRRSPSPCRHGSPPPEGIDEEAGRPHLTNFSPSPPPEDRHRRRRRRTVGRAADRRSDLSRPRRREDDPRRPTSSLPNHPRERLFRLCPLVPESSRRRHRACRRLQIAPSRHLVSRPKSIPIRRSARIARVEVITSVHAPGNHCSRRKRSRRPPENAGFSYSSRSWRDFSVETSNSDHYRIRLIWWGI